MFIAVKGVLANSPNEFATTFVDLATLLPPGFTPAQVVATGATLREVMEATMDVPVSPVVDELARELLEAAKP
jgi:hypothetical protein